MLTLELALISDRLDHLLDALRDILAELVDLACNKVQPAATPFRAICERGWVEWNHSRLEVSVAARFWDGLPGWVGLVMAVGKARADVPTLHVGRRRIFGREVFFLIRDALREWIYERCATVW